MKKSKLSIQRHIVGLTSLVLVLVLLPPLLLLPAGLLWLWQQGWLLWWLVSLATLTLSGYLIATWIRRRMTPEQKAGAEAEADRPVTPPNEAWSPLDLEAWDEVQRLARETDQSILASQTLLLQRARVVIERVAAHYYPEDKDPIWNFTLPEALLLSERVSLRLRLVLADHLPAAHLFQVGQLMRLWQVRSSGMKYYRGAKLAYRFVRLVNPLSALVAEARERILDVALDSTSSYLRQKGARIWVEEVGRSAIDLYSGRLQANARTLADQAARETETLPPPGPVQVLIAGQVNTGKSSLVNALLEDTQAAVDHLPTTENSERYQLNRDDGEPLAVLIDSPGITEQKSQEWWGRQCAGADCILWVVAAHRADRHLDYHGLQAIRDWFEANPRRTRPPISIVVSHIDRLSPAREWSPPYDLVARTQPKAQAIGEALDHIAADLKLPDADLIPVRLDQGRDGYNVDLLWAILKEHLEVAKHGRAQRLQLMTRKKDWKQLLKQARAGGRLVRSALERSRD